ncbi:MAG: malectin domain-containing carbohydrate-binding protein [Phycisphaerae bacterium]
MNCLCAGTLSERFVRVRTYPPNFARALCIALATLPACSSAASAQQTDSRLGLHMIINYTSGASQVVNAHPRIHKILDTNGAMLASARDFKNNNPNGALVLRIYTAKSYNISHDPAWAANDFWNTVLAPPINALSAQDRALIDYVEGPNECDSTPCWGSVQNAQWLNNFWLSLAPLIAGAGFRPCAFSIPVGNPPGSLSDMYAQLDAIVPALRVCKSYNGGWSYHAYTIPYSKDVSTEIWYSLRYRQFYSYFQSTYSDLANLPLLLTEGGVDGQSGAGGPGWKVDDANRYIDWLTWFDARMKEDPYVVGCTLFQSGDLYNWFSFDTEEINPWLAQHILSSVPPAPPAPPANLNAAINGPTSVHLTWSTASGATSYNVKRSTTSGGPYSTIGTSTRLNFTDSDLTIGNTYHYVVSAVNSVGESANSNESTVTVTGGYAVNSGGSAAGRFAADTSYDHGYTYATTASIDTAGVTDPAPQVIYQSERWASPSFTYTFPNLAPGAEYTVRLHFAEIYFTSAGKRRFNVSINGTQVLTDFDIMGTAGAANKAVVHTFTTNANPSGQIIIQYSAGSADNPKSGGIEIIRNLPPVYVGDFDQDLDIDQTDFGLLQVCFSGNGITQDDPSCTAADLDGDADVDHADFGIFLNCLSGQDLTPPMACRK